MAAFFLGNSADIAPGYEGRASLEVNVAQRTSTLRISELTMKDSRHYQCNVQVPNDDEGKTIAITSVLVLGERKVTARCLRCVLFQNHSLIILYHF